MRRREFVLASASIVGATSVGAVAFTQANLTRDVAVNVVADDTAPITLRAGSTDAVTLSNGQLRIDTNTGRATGLNGDGSFTYGDDGQATSGSSDTHAFRMTNNGGGSRDFTISLENFNLGGSSSIELSLYDGSGSVGDVTTDSDVTQTLASSDTLYAVVTFDTSGLDTSSNMNGDLKIDAVTTP